MSSQSTDRVPERPAKQSEVSGSDQQETGNLDTALARNPSFAALGGLARPGLLA